MEKPPVLNEEQVIKWIKDNYGENAIIAPLAHGKTAQRDKDVEWYEKKYLISDYEWNLQQARREIVKTQTSLKKRFWAKVVVAQNHCWEWTGADNGKGYGQFWDGQQLVPAHRIAFEWLRGEIPEGLELDHLCRNKKCVNPMHLELVTRSENTKRGIGPALAAQKQRAKTHCPHGHPYSPENTYITPVGGRQCIICRNARNRRYKQSLKSKYLIPPNPVGSADL